MRQSKMAIMISGTTLAIVSLFTSLMATEPKHLHLSSNQVHHIRMPDNSLSFREIKDYQNYKIIATHWRIDKNKLLYVLANDIAYKALKASKMPMPETKEKFCIEDNGVGIAKEKEEKIFERFYRASTEVGGFGIGLSIVKNIVQKYNYRINIDSKSNVSTTHLVSILKQSQIKEYRENTYNFNSYLFIPA